MLLRICLIIAIVAGLAAGGLSFVKVQDIIVTTRAARNDWNNKYTAENQKRLKADKDLASTKKELDTTKKDLAQTKTELEASNAKVSELDKHNSDLTAELEKTRADRDTAQQKLAQWDQVGLEPGKVKALIENLDKAKKALAAVNSENKILAATLKDTKNELAKLIDPNREVLLPAGLRGKVLAVDPKYDFVVLDIGDDQGAKERGEMMVNRGGKLIGKVRISSVMKDRSVANIMPDWKSGEVMEGDEVLY